MEEDIKSALKEIGWTQAALADKLEISRGYLSDILSGKKTPSLRLYRRLMQAISTPPGVPFVTREVPAGEQGGTIQLRLAVPKGFIESDAIPFSLSPEGMKLGEKWRERVTSACIALSERGANLDILTSTKNIQSLSILKGDIVLIDPSLPARDGDTVATKIVDQRHGGTRTSLRTVTSGFLLSREADEAEPAIPISATHATVIGVLAGVIRLSTRA